MISLFQQPDYDDIDDENQINIFSQGRSDKGKDNKKYGKRNIKL